MALQNYAPLATDALGLARTFLTAQEPVFSAPNARFATAKDVYKPMCDEILALGKGLYLSGTSPRLTGKSRIINGACEIDQRRSGVAKTSAPSGEFIVDRFPYYKAGGALTAVHTVQQSTDVPLAADFARESRAYIPFSSSILVDCTTIDTATSTLVNIRHVIEGYNVKDVVGDSYNLGFTLSFWHKHTKTGINCVRFSENGSHSYVAEYTQNVSDRWEFSTVTVTAVPSGGTWNKTNGAGLYIDWAIEAGSTSGVIGTANSWLAANAYATSNQVNNCDNTANNWRIAGVQFEAGVVATPFDFRLYPIERALCQRYCYQRDSDPTNTQTIAVGSVLNGTSLLQTVLNLPVLMRMAPSLEISAVGDFVNSDGLAALAVSALVLSTAASAFTSVINSTSGALTSGRGGTLLLNNATGKYFRLVAEL